jgi:hypothetical protein
MVLDITKNHGDSLEHMIILTDLYFKWIVQQTRIQEIQGVED